MFQSQKRIREQLKSQFGKNPTKDPYHYIRRDRLKLIKKFHEKMGTGTVDEVTWNDLEMDDVFFRINNTKSYIGEQVLYHKLHCTDSENSENFGQAVHFFEENEDKRLIAEQYLLKVGKKSNSYYMPQLIDILTNCEIKFDILYKFLQLLFFVSLALGVIFHNTQGVLFFTVVACINLLIYMKKKAESEYMMDCLYGICNLLYVCEAFINKKCLPDKLIEIERIREDIKKLHSLKKMIGAIIAKKNNAAADPQGMLADYIIGITLFDIVSFNKIVKTIRGNEESVMRIYEVVGTIDMLISIASFRKSLPEYCLPEDNNNEIINVSNIYHPLIENAIKNSVVLNKSTMIMGANASGKSTFMKALAVNMILAQTIFTCCAQRFVYKACLVMTSMAVRDDISSGESYYVREVKYLKRMLNEAEKGSCVLYCIDEILKGTNNKERLAASKAVLSYLCRKSGMIIVSTHDSELARSLKEYYDFYHFDSEFIKGSIKFDYLIKKGFGEGSNAIDLLSCYDFPKEVVEEARCIVEQEQARNMAR